MSGQNEAAAVTRRCLLPARKHSFCRGGWWELNRGPYGPYCRDPMKVAQKPHSRPQGPLAPNETCPTLGTRPGQLR